MARINIEEKLLLDIRFKALSRKMGEYAAIGAWVTVAFVAQRYWGDGQQLIPLDIWELGGLPNEMVDCHLVEKRSEGYYLKGSEVYFAWYESRCQLAKKGRDRIKSKKAEIAEKSNIRPNIESNIRPSESLILDLVDGNTTSPPTPTPTPTPIIKKESALHETMRSAWNEIARPNDLPLCRAITEKRIKSINRAMAKNPDLDWPSFFATLPNSRFLMGENDRNWKVDFDFAINSENINKILEGKYVNTLSKKLEEEQKKNNEYFLQDGQIAECTTAVNFKEIL